MKKYSYIILLVAVLCVLCLTGCLESNKNASGEFPREGQTVDGFEYYFITDDTVAITRYNGNLTEVTVPSKIGGYPVTALETTFSMNKAITAVTVPEGVESINSAFYGCTNLVSAELPSSITDITSAFYGCSSLTSVKLPRGLGSIASGAFSGCSSLISIEIPSSVQEISADAFSGCTSLTEVRIPTGINSIGMGAFQGCTALKAIDIPAAVKDIGFSAFEGCSALEILTFAVGLERIGDSAFANCSSLEEIVLPIGLEELGAGVFGGCKKLADVVIPSSISIEMDAFYGTAYALKNILTITDAGALIGINLPEGVTGLVIPEGVRSIAASLPEDNLIESIVLPASLESGEDFADRQYSLKSITVAADNARYFSIDGVLFDRTYDRIAVYPMEKTDATFTVPEGIKVFNISNRYLKQIIVPEILLSDLNSYFNEVMQDSQMVSSPIEDDDIRIAELSLRAFLDNNSFEKITFDYQRPQNADAVEQWFEQNYPEITINWK